MTCIAGQSPQGQQKNNSVIARVSTRCRQATGKIAHGFLQVLFQLALWLQVVQAFAVASDVGLALQGVVGQQEHED
jgi:hypothetical protein